MEGRCYVTKKVNEPEDFCFVLEWCGLQKTYGYIDNNQKSQKKCKTGCLK